MMIYDDDDDDDDGVGTVEAPHTQTDKAGGANMRRGERKGKEGRCAWSGRLLAGLDQAVPALLPLVHDADGARVLILEDVKVVADAVVVGGSQLNEVGRWGMVVRGVVAWMWMGVYGTQGRREGMWVGVYGNARKKRGDVLVEADDGVLDLWFFRSMDGWVDG